MTGDPARDAEATEHNFIGGEDNDYVAAKAEKETCGRPLAHWENPHVSTPCGRPSGHDGDCHPVPLAADKEGGDA